jgi:hypothetical protein
LAGVTLTKPMPHLLIVAAGTLTFLILPAAALIAGRWTGDRTVPLLGLGIPVIRLAVSAITNQVVEAAAREGTRPMGVYVARFQMVINLADALLIAALVLLVARAARDRNNRDPRRA